MAELSLLTFLLYCIPLFPWLSWLSASKSWVYLQPSPTLSFSLELPNGGFSCQTSSSLCFKSNHLCFPFFSFISDLKPWGHLTPPFVLSSITNLPSWPLQFLSHLSLPLFFLITLLDQIPLVLFFLKHFNYSTLLISVLRHMTHRSWLIFPRNSITLITSQAQDISWLLCKHLRQVLKAFHTWSYTSF